MTPTDLDTAYTALAQATARVGEAQAPLFLATLALSLIARHDDASVALALISQAEGLTRGDAQARVGADPTGTPRATQETP